MDGLLQMKMKKIHYDYIRKEIKKSVKKHPDIKREYNTVIRFRKRVRWSVFWVAIKGKWCNRVLYSYLNDNHIDTALKSIFKELVENES